MDEHLVLLEGGSRGGETTTLARGVDRVFAVSQAPGMVDVYRRTGRSGPAPGNPDPAVIFEFAGQEPAGDLGPDMLHMPPHRGGGR